MQLESVRRIHNGQFLTFYELDYKDRSGNAKTYEMVSRAGSSRSKEPFLRFNAPTPAQAITLMVFDENQSKVLIPFEFRMALNRVVVNQISGLIDLGECEEQAAARELLEETGLELVSILDKLPPSTTCAGITDDIATQLICTAKGNLRESDSANEEIHCQWMDKKHVRELLKDQEILISGRMQAYLYMWTHV